MHACICAAYGPESSVAWPSEPPTPTRHQPSESAVSQDEWRRGSDHTVQAAAAAKNSLAAKRDFLFKYAVMLAIGLAGASPRALVLYLSRHVPSVSVAQALSDFPALWAPCAKEGAAFSAHSPEGSLYKYLIGSDRAIKGACMTLAFVAALGSGIGEQKRGRNGGIRCCAALMSVLIFLAGTVVHLCLLMLAPTIETLFVVERGEKVYMVTLYVALVGATVALLSFVDARERMVLSMRKRESVALVARKAKLLLFVMVRPLMTPVRLPCNIYTEWSTDPVLCNGTVA